MLERLDQLPSELVGLRRRRRRDLGDRPTTPICRAARRRQPATRGARQWVRMGGKLIVTVGPRRRRSCSAADCAAGAARAGQVRGDGAAAAEHRAGNLCRDHRAARRPGAAGCVRSAQLGDVRGKIEAYAGNQPARLAAGGARAARLWRGRVRRRSISTRRRSPTGPPGRSCSTSCFGRRRSAEPRATAVAGPGDDAGFNDLAGQFTARSISSPACSWCRSGWWPLLDPGLHRLHRPARLFSRQARARRWSSLGSRFALIGRAFSAGGLCAGLWSQRAQLRVNQVDLVDFDAESELVRGTSWANVFSPEHRRLRSVARPQRSERRLRAGASRRHAVFLDGLARQWLRRHEPSAGATCRCSPSRTISRRGSTRSERVPIAIWSTKAFVGRWWRHASQPIEAELSDDGQLAGTLTSRLDAPLDDCVLIYDRWAYPLRQLEPGQQIDIDSELDPANGRDLSSRHVTVQRRSRRVDALRSRRRSTLPGSSRS